MHRNKTIFKCSTSKIFLPNIFFIFFIYLVIYFFLCFSKTEFLCIALTALELRDRPASAPPPPRCWD